MSGFLATTDLIKGQGIKIVSADSIEVDHQTIYRYRAVPDPPRDDQTSISMELLPDRSWAIHHIAYETTATAGSGRRQFKQSYREAITVEYAADQASLPVPRRVRCENSFRDETFDFRRFTLGVATPEREFTLGYFGLPDATSPITLEPQRSDFASWMFGLGGLSLIGAILTRRGRATSRNASE